MEQTVAVRVENVRKSFTAKGKTELVLQDVSFSVKKGEIVSILGQSGCGKSTLLNIIGGFVRPDSGTVLLDGRVVERPSRRCVMLFQNYGLLPWRSVLKNVELGLEELPIPPQQRREQAMEYLKLVGLGEKADMFPHQLSGGMQQRVALARALSLRPELILMDEPFAALDTFNRYHLQNELLRMQRREKATIILVTHDIDEAVYLSDRVMIMSAHPGQIHKEIRIQSARPRDRGHGDFQHYRRLILEEFSFHTAVPTVEFSI